MSGVCAGGTDQWDARGDRMQEKGRSDGGGLDTLERFDRLRQENLARLLVRAFDMMEGEVLDRMAEEGIRLKRTWLPVLRNVDLAGSQITEIADAAGLAKQTVGPLVRELTEQGILRVDPDPEDGRAKRVRYTEAGAEGLKKGVAVLQSVERAYAEAVGPERYRELRRTLMDLLAEFE